VSRWRTLPARCTAERPASSLATGTRNGEPDDAALIKFELVEAQPTSSVALIATYRPIR